MKVKEICFEDYPHKTVLILTPKNFKFNRGATFPPESEARIKEIYGEQELADENPLYPDEQGIVLTLRLKNEFYPYGASGK